MREILTEELVEDIYSIRALVLHGEDGKPIVLPRRAGSVSKQKIEKPRSRIKFLESTTPPQALNLTYNRD
jgi:hypothetical protein